MPDTGKHIVDLRDVEKSYGQDRPVLKDCCLLVAPGESVAVVGPSGSGKSTLLNLIAALDSPDSGTVTVDNKNLSDLNDNQLAEFRNRSIGFVFQLHHLLDQCTVGENVLLPALPFGNSGKTVTRAHKLLARVGLEDRINDYPARLSGGQRQRVAVVRALINSPSVLLADEPTGSLDRETAGEVTDLLVDLQREEQTALIVVTHSEEIAGRMSRSLHLRDGKLVSAGNGDCV